MRKKHSIDEQEHSYKEVEGFTADKKEEISERLRRIRKNTIEDSRPMTQESLSEKIGVDRGTIQKWENGERPNDLPSLDAMAKYSRIFKTSISSLLGEEITEKQIEEQLGINKEFQDRLKDFIFKDEYMDSSKKRLRFLNSCLKSELFNHICEDYQNFVRQIDEYKEYRERAHLDEEAQRLYNIELLKSNVNEMRRRIVLSFAEAMERLQSQMIDIDVYQVVPSYKIMKTMEKKNNEENED